MSTKYNHFAKDLDAAFKAARNEYAAAYNAVEQTRKAMQDAGQDALKRQIATLQLQEAEAAERRRALEKEVQTSNLADPSAIDSNAVELMKTGVLTVDDYFGFADRFSENPTMLKLVGYYAKEAADGTDDRKDRVALTVLAQDCAKGTGKTLKAWDDLMTTVNYCSGRGGTGNKRQTPGVVVSMGEWWDQLSGEIIENF